MTYLLHRWSLLLFLSILRKDGIKWREFRGEGARISQQAWLTWAHLAANLTLGWTSQRETASQGEQFLPSAGHLQAHGWSTSFVPPYERDGQTGEEPVGWSGGQNAGRMRKRSRELGLLAF